MTRDELVNYALQRLRDTTTPPAVFPCDLVCNYVNAAYAKINGANPNWPWLETVTSALSITAGTNQVALPTGAWRVLSVFNCTDGYALREITGRNSFANQWPQGSTEPGQIISYRVFNNAILVYPYAGSTTSLRVEYELAPARLAAAADVPIIPTEFHDLLVEYTMHLAYTDDGNLEQAAAHLQVFNARLEELKNSVLGPRGESYAQINDSWY